MLLVLLCRKGWIQVLESLPPPKLRFLVGEVYQTQQNQQFLKAQSELAFFCTDTAAGFATESIA